MSFEDCVSDALAAVLDWEIPDEACGGAVLAQACLLAGVEPDEMTD